jgi:hypothetical protein
MRSRCPLVDQAIVFESDLDMAVVNQTPRKACDDAAVSAIVLCGGRHGGCPIMGPNLPGQC